MEVDLERIDLSTLSKEDLSLITKVIRSLSSMNIPRDVLLGICRGDELRRPYLVRAYVYAQPLRIDFQARLPGEYIGAFIGPQIPLAAGLFGGSQNDKFSYDVIREVEHNFDKWMRHINEKVA